MRKDPRCLGLLTCFLGKAVDGTWRPTTFILGLVVWLSFHSKKPSRASWCSKSLVLRKASS